MAEPVEVQRYDLEPVDSLGTAYTIGGEPSPTGEVCMWDEIEPLLAELAELRERTRMRPKTDTSHGDNQVIVKHVPYASDEVVVSLGRMREFGWSYVQGWWPLPGETNG